MFLLRIYVPILWVSINILVIITTFILLNMMFRTVTLFISSERVWWQCSAALDFLQRCVAFQVFMCFLDAFLKWSSHKIYLLSIKLSNAADLNGVYFLVEEKFALLLQFNQELFLEIDLTFWKQKFVWLYCFEMQANLCMLLCTLFQQRKCKQT